MEMKAKQHVDKLNDMAISRLKNQKLNEKAQRE